MLLPPLNALRYFEATARLLSLSRAGEELHVTHTAISHQIKHLESWMGTRLLSRSGRGVALTPAGAEYYRMVSGALAVIANATVNVRRNRNPRTITVGCIPSIAARWLIPSLPMFTEQHPDTNVRIVYARAQERFDSENLDVLITFGEDGSPNVNCHLLFSRINKPVASPHYLATHPEIRAHNGLRKAELLHDETMEAWKAWFEKAQVEPPRSMKGTVFQDFNMLATAVIAGHGVALCPVKVFSYELQRGDLVVISEISTLDDQGYFIVSGKNTTNAVTSFVSWFESRCVDFEFDPPV